jgi:Autophagy-related protein 101
LRIHFLSGRHQRTCRLQADSQQPERGVLLGVQIVLSFYEKRVRQQWGLAFGKQEERLFWEQWCVSDWQSV